MTLLITLIVISSLLNSRVPLCLIHIQPADISNKDLLKFYFTARSLNIFKDLLVTSRTRDPRTLEAPQGPVETFAIIRDP